MAHWLILSAQAREWGIDNGYGSLIVEAEQFRAAYRRSKSVDSYQYMSLADLGKAKSRYSKRLDRIAEAIKAKA